MKIYKGLVGKCSMCETITIGYKHGCFTYLKFTHMTSLRLLQKWGAIHYFKSLWDFLNEKSSLHFNDFTLLKLFHYNITM